MTKEHTKIYYPWQERNLIELSLIKQGGLKILPDCDWLFPGTGEILESWIEQQKPIMVNTVIVSPNEGELPLRAMCYLLGAAQTMSALKTRDFNTKALRVINPCHLNVYCDGGNLDYQLSYGERLVRNFNEWINRHFPDLTDIQIILDQGEHISDSLLADARHYASKIGARTRKEIQDRIINHDGREDRAALYLLAHPLAWHYSYMPGLFIPRDSETGIINYMPQSEMLYLTTMVQAGVKVMPSESDVVTSISRRVIHAPYYFLKEDEPVLDWAVRPVTLQSVMGELREKAGHLHNAEILGCLGPLRALLQNSRDLGRSKGLTGRIF